MTLAGSNMIIIMLKTMLIPDTRMMMCLDSCWCSSCQNVRLTEGWGEDEAIAWIKKSA